MNSNTTLQKRAEEHLQHIILPYWNNLLDTENGGFYGYVGYNLDVDKKADKGVILHSRILWFYSTVYKITGGKENLAKAHHAFAFLQEHCVDEKHGGLYWMMKYDGKPADTTKNAYNQAFGIYALAAYAEVSGSQEALRMAYSLFECIETYCTDKDGYLEAFTADWKTPVESAICDQGVVADKTMNTLLHVLEAYTGLFASDAHPLVGEKLVHIVELCRDKLYKPDFERLEVFFDSHMNPLGDIHSYGHDIEASWLLDKACAVLEAKRSVLTASASVLNALLADTRAYTTVIANKIRNTAFKNGALNNEARGERSGSVHVDTDRIWWVQAESVVGFYNEYQKHGGQAFKDAAKEIFEYIETYIVDKRAGSEWFWYVDNSGKPKTDHGITEAWKCPYHNGRMCLELIERKAL